MVRNKEQMVRGMILIAALAVIIIYAALFLPFLPGPHALMGHDYGMTLPQLLDNYIWFKNNGLFSVYWFSPSFCGGAPVFAHPISYFYSVIQILTFWLGPLPAVGMSFLIFGILGFGGFYLLMYRFCACSRSVSFLCAVLFLFNGFYWSKVLIGAPIYESFMLIPWAVALLMPSPEGKVTAGIMRSARHSLLTGILIAYMVYSGMQTLLPAALLTILLTGFLFGIFSHRGFSPGAFTVRFVLSCLIASGLTAAKLCAIFYFIANFPRNQYLLPQFENPIDLLRVLSGSLWGMPVDVLARDAMVNAQFVMGRHEFEFGLGPVPFLILGGATLMLFVRFIVTGPAGRGIGWRQCAAVCAVCIMAAIPAGLNLYTPGWNAFLQKIPVIGSSTQCVRWFSVYIPPVVLLTGVVLQRRVTSGRWRRVFALTGVLITLFFNMTMERDYYYLQQSYSGLRVQQAFQAIKNGTIDPRITDISLPVDDCGRPGAPIYRNDAFVYNHSQMLCYDSMFGYGLESLPFKTLHPGPVMSLSGGVFNIKNPSCYVFPDANGCSPGDHFTDEQEKSVFAFTHYRPFPFVMPLAQKIANGVTLCCLFFCFAFLTADGMMAGFRKLRATTSFENRRKAA